MHQKKLTPAKQKFLQNRERDHESPNQLQPQLKIQLDFQSNNGRGMEKCYKSERENTDRRSMRSDLREIGREA